MNMNTGRLLVSVIGCALASSLAQSHATSVTYDLGTGNPGLSGYSGPYATATVDLTSPTTATITFASLTSGGNIYLMGDGGSVAVNVNAASWTLGTTIIGVNGGTGFTPGPYSNGGAGNEDGFGSFNQTINGFDGFDHSADNVTFTLTDTSGTWTDPSEVLTANAGGSVAAAHIFVTAYPANQANGALTTGYAADGSQVPDGGTTVALMGLGLLGLSSARKVFLRV